ncbi:hypothetical protein [Nonomuraea rubra]|uniref:hypothetical protein n=1 Tax=Nonomuraea rubra TaxID=46180 RepID=UPI0031E7A64A
MSWLSAAAMPSGSSNEGMASSRNAWPTARGTEASRAATADRPSTAFGFDRISLIVPSRMSPRASGRSGMMPGRSAGGGM